MGYFDRKKNVKDYIKMVDGFDGRELIEVLNKHLPAGSTVLELGMGPGKDLDILKEHYQATGSDNSRVFLDFYRKRHEKADLLLLDAVTLDTSRRFDCIYTNKVLQHLETADLKRSLKRQLDLLNPGGLVCHSFWKGSLRKEFRGLLFVHYTEDDLKELFRKGFEILEMESYWELEEETEHGDSIYLVAKRR